MKEKQWGTGGDVLYRMGDNWIEADKGSLAGRSLKHILDCDVEFGEQTKGRKHLDSNSEQEQGIIRVNVDFPEDVAKVERILLKQLVYTLEVSNRVSEKDMKGEEYRHRSTQEQLENARARLREYEDTRKGCRFW